MEHRPVVSRSVPDPTCPGLSVWALAWLGSFVVDVVVGIHQPVCQVAGPVDKVLVVPSKATGPVEKLLIYATGAPLLEPLIEALLEAWREVGVGAVNRTVEPPTPKVSLYILARRCLERLLRYVHYGERLAKAGCSRRQLQPRTGVREKGEEVFPFRIVRDPRFYPDILEAKLRELLLSSAPLSDMFRFKVRFWAQHSFVFILRSGSRLMGGRFMESRFMRGSEHRRTSDGAR